jgi:hypothetical protein
MSAPSSETSGAAREDLGLHGSAAQVDNTDPRNISELEHADQASFNKPGDSVDPDDNELNALRLKIRTSWLRLGLVNTLMTAKSHFLGTLKIDEEDLYSDEEGVPKYLTTHLTSVPQGSITTGSEHSKLQAHCKGFTMESCHAEMLLLNQGIRYLTLNVA